MADMTYACFSECTDMLTPKKAIIPKQLSVIKLSNIFMHLKLFTVITPCEAFSFKW